MARAVPPAPTEPAESPESTEAATFGAAATTRRSAIAWWTVFIGPAVIALTALVAGIIGDRQTVLWVFPVAVWAFTLILGAAAAPDMPGPLWFVPAIAMSFVSAAAAFFLLFGVNELSVRASVPTTTTTTAARNDGSPTVPPSSPRPPTATSGPP